MPHLRHINKIIKPTAITMQDTYLPLVTISAVRRKARRSAVLAKAMPCFIGGRVASRPPWRGRLRQMRHHEAHFYHGDSVASGRAFSDDAK